MKVIRYEDPYGKIHHAVEGQQAGPLRVEGDPLHGFQVTGETAIVGKILAPVVPTMIWCIGKNYRRHADEVGMGVDEYPGVFAKGANAVQDPGQPIRFPERAKSSEIDYEGELVVVIGKACKDVARERHPCMPFRSPPPTRPRNRFRSFWRAPETESAGPGPAPRLLLWQRPLGIRRLPCPLRRRGAGSFSRCTRSWSGPPGPKSFRRWRFLRSLGIHEADHPRRGAALPVGPRQHDES